MKKKLFECIDGNFFKVKSTINESVYDTVLLRQNPETGKSEELDVIVKYEYLKATRGEREPGGGQIDPDTSNDVDISFVIDRTTKRPIELSNDEEDALKDEILDYIND